MRHWTRNPDTVNTWTSSNPDNYTLCVESVNGIAYLSWLRQNEGKHEELRKKKKSVYLWAVMDPDGNILVSEVYTSSSEDGAKEAGRLASQWYDTMKAMKESK